MESKNCQKLIHGSKSLNSVEAINLLANLSKDWSINIENKLFAAYKFKDYDEALEYVLKISKISAQQNHHPDISFGWGYVKIILYSHALRGLHHNDFILAQKIDQLKNVSNQLQLL
jgi:4a-hydroxytetrahydrobiopterin dehydratase